MATYYTEGIILKRQNVRESDKIVTIYTKDYGKIQALAKGSRKIKSKLAGSLEPFFYTRLMLAHGRNIDKIASSEVIENFSKLREDLSKINLSSYIVDLLDRLTKVHHGDTIIFNLLRQTFLVLENKNRIKNEEAKKIKLFFVWRMLSLLGFQPAIFYCTHCHGQISPEQIIFSFKKGGLVCRLCNPKQEISDKNIISANAVKILRIILKKDVKDLMLINVNNNTLDELEAVTYRFSEYVIEDKIPAG